MSASWSKHIDEAELLLREASQDAAQARDVMDLVRVLVHVQMAIGHAALAEAKRISK